MAPKPKPARFEFTVGMVLAMALTILVVMTWAVAAPSSSPIYHPQLLLLYLGGRPALCRRRQHFRCLGLCCPVPCPALWRDPVHLKSATRLSDDPQCYWQLPRRRLPSRAVLVCRRHFRIFRQVA